MLGIKAANLTEKLKLLGNKLLMNIKPTPSLTCGLISACGEANDI